MRRTSLILCVLSGIFIIGCAGKMYDRIEVPPSDEFTLYARGLSTDQQLEEAADRAAVLNARNELASALEVHIKSLTKSATEQVGINQDAELNRMFTEAIKATVDQTLNFSVLHDAKQTIWDKRVPGWRAEVVYKIDLTVANRNLLDNVKERQRLYERLRSGELWQELEDEIERQRATSE